MGALIAETAAVVVGIPTLYLLGGWMASRRRWICPTCKSRALRCVQWIHATVMIDGRRAPDSWSYFSCDSCGAHFKQHLGRDFVTPSAEEWIQYCAPKTVKGK